MAADDEDGEQGMAGPTVVEEVDGEGDERVRLPRRNVGVVGTRDDDDDDNNTPTSATRWIR
jgi:hypothetical protein